MRWRDDARCYFGHCGKLAFCAQLDRTGRQIARQIPKIMLSHSERCQALQRLILVMFLVEGAVDSVHNLASDQR